MLVILVSLSQLAVAGVFTYECEAVPEDAGWEIVAFYCTPEVSIQNDHLVQAVQVGGCHPPPNGDQESLSRSLVDFDGSPTFFIEWRVETDGDRSEIPGTAPALLSAGSLGSTKYHITIARDRVRFIRAALISRRR